jgi:N-acetylated-alpha-linked acidic dipeptidase
MANESTPLIQTVRIGPARRRYSHNTCRRFCTLASACLLITGFTIFLAHVFLVWPHHYHHGRHSRYSDSRENGETVLTFDDLEAILLGTPSSELAEKWLRYYTSGPHLAGKNISQAEWTRDRWEEWGVASEIVAYDCYTNYPVDHSLTLLKQSKKSKSWDVSFKASLEEDVLKDDPTTALEDRIPTFHGYSASGNVTGSFVFANYGTYQDYQDLVDFGVDLTGKVVIAKYGGIFRGLKVKRAQELGAIGVLLYSDPGDDGEITELNGYDYYPKGPARNPSAVQRGSVQFLSTSPGDP